MEENQSSIGKNLVLDSMDLKMPNQDKSLGVSDEDDGDAASMDSMLCVSGSRLVPMGFVQSDCTDLSFLAFLSALLFFAAEDCVMLVNAGDTTIRENDSNLKLKPDTCFQGGDVIGTESNIINGGEYPFIYQSARYGNFCYLFENFLPGDYFVDLHFAEIIHVNGPKAMRVLSELDIYSIVGANKPLQLVDVRVLVGQDRKIALRFEGVHGSPVISGICIRKASNPVPEAKPVFLICKSCTAEIEVPSSQNKLMQLKSIAKYEQKIQELTNQCQLKTNECYEAWMSLKRANEQLDKVRMELCDKIRQARSLDQTLEKQTAELGNVTSRYEHDKGYWVAAVNDLEQKIKIMKREQSQLSREAHECADSVPDLNKMVFAVQELVTQYEDLKLKYNEEQAKRKKLHNQVEEAKGMVFCRCRPLNMEEVSAGYPTVVDFDAAKDGDLGVLTGGSTKKTFKFDRVYSPKDDQVDVFVDASPMVVSVLDGYNVCIFAYGQTGTGKTFTMEGTEKNRGFNYRTLEELFKIAKDRSEFFIYNISVSVLEVYNEQIRDLLATSPTSKKLEIRQASEGVHPVPGIVEAKVENIKKVWDVLQAGSNARAVGSNNVNEHSSRSHCLLSIMVRAKNLISGESTNSKLWLVDLAGSERLGKTDVQGERLKEAQYINKSLSALGDVISALASKTSHIPYRNSKLTHLLQDSLGGDSKTLMFVQISPLENDLGETISSLNFATRVRGVELGPAKKKIDSGEMQKMKIMLDKVKQESRFKEESIRKLEENFQILESKAKSKDQFCKNQQEKVKELEGQLDSEMELHRKQLHQLTEKLMGREESYTSLQYKVKELENKFKERENAETMQLQLKVKDLERERAQQQSDILIMRQKVKELKYKLQEKEQNSELLILHRKVKELEEKLREREQQSDCMLLLHSAEESVKSAPNEQNSELLILHRKVKELEEKLREREQQSDCMLLLHSAEESVKSAPNERERDEPMRENSDPQILRCSTPFKRLKSQESSLLREPDSLREIRRKREIISIESENGCGVSTSLFEKKMAPTDLKKARQVPNEIEKTKQIDSSKALARFARTTKSVTVQRLSSQSRINKDQLVGVKDRDKCTKGWTR
ncbi:hypothetical protein GIB67_006436 [Kingdonia uniflora]|uniref:Kinesin motor domain-containing protein n=1 Tax=Kingdonia uniflora TaxID=39325 RepID=A0A7J7NED9_9MAGN|nr:hypothetical protein GIB67_006436 [Kingdonia uniflora]